MLPRIISVRYFRKFCRAFGLREIIVCYDNMLWRNALHRLYVNMLPVLRHGWDGLFELSSIPEQLDYLT